MEQARKTLNEVPIALVVCGVYFDEHRMYDLLRYTRENFPEIPVVCARIVDAEIPRISREALEIAARSLGAAAFVDMTNTLSAAGGDAAADAELRTAVLTRVPESAAHGVSKRR
jgi:hypothetical protein